MEPNLCPLNFKNWDVLIFVEKKIWEIRTDRILKTKARKASTYKTAPKFKWGKKKETHSFTFLFAFSPFLPFAFPLLPFSFLPHCPISLPSKSTSLIQLYNIHYLFLSYSLNAEDTKMTKEKSLCHQRHARKKSLSSRTCLQLSRGPRM